jgi:hypothetical protein
MAFQLPLTDKFGNVYPQGYRKYSWFSIEPKKKRITAIFEDYPSKAFRDAHPDDVLGTITYTIGPQAVPARLDEVGNVIEPAIPAFDDYMNADNSNPTGYGAGIYGFALSRPENAGAISV